MASTKVLSKLEVLSQAEISRIYNVSRPTPGNWLKEAIDKQNALQLTKIKNKYYIIDNQFNKEELSRLKKRGEKYRNKIGYEKIIPDSKIYSIFSQTQLIDLIKKMEDDRTIPHKYTFLDNGHKTWDDYFKSTLFEGKEKTYLTEEIGLIGMSLEYIKARLEDYDDINIIDLSYGNNGYSTKLVIKKLLELKNKINYYSLEISKQCSEITKKYLQFQFPDLPINTDIGDLEFKMLKDKFFLNKIDSGRKSCNLILLLNSHVSDVTDRKRLLRNLSESMGKDDMMLFNNGLRSERDHQDWIDFYNNVTIKKHVTWIPKLLGIAPNCYTLEQGYDPKIESKIIFLRFTKDIDLDFKLKGFSKTLTFRQNEKLTVYCYFSYTIKDLFTDLQNVGLIQTMMLAYPGNSYMITMVENDKTIKSYKNFGKEYAA